MNQSADPYAALFAELKRELATRAANGQPLNISVWDGNHTHPAVYEIMADPRLPELLRPYGQPVRIMEEARSARLANSLAANAPRFSDAQLDAIEQRFYENSRSMLGNENTAQRISHSYRSVLDQVEEGVPLYYPDPRGELFEQLLATPEGQSGQQQYAHYMSALAPVDLKCIAQFQTAYLASLSPQQQEDYAAMDRLYSQLLATPETDHEIGHRSLTRFPQQAGGTKPIFITSYGLAHFNKGADINEALPGISVAIVDSPGAIGFAYENADIQTDLPDYAYYTRSGELVRLDTQASQFAFLGMPEAPAEIAALPPTERAEAIDRAAAVTSTADRALLNECRAMLAHLQPFQSEGSGSTIPSAARQTGAAAGVPRG